MTRVVVIGDVGGHAEQLRHVFSMPLGYLTRPYVVYRSRDTGLGTRAPRRGWERPAGPGTFVPPRTRRCDLRSPAGDHGA